MIEGEEISIGWLLRVGRGRRGGGSSRNELAVGQVYWYSPFGANPPELEVAERTFEGYLEQVLESIKLPFR